MQELNSNGRVPQTNGNDELRVPLDLRDWIDTEEIKAWVTEEVDTLDWKNPELLKYLDAHPDFRPQALLSLLIYAIFKMPLWVQRARRLRHWTWLVLLLWFIVEIWIRVIAAAIAL